MTKILIIISLLLYSVSASASDFYMKGIVGTSKLRGMKEIKQSLDFTTKQDSNLSPSVGIGIGYNLPKGIRTEINVHIYSAYFDLGTANLHYVNNNGSRSMGNVFTDRKATIQTLMHHYYIPIFNRGNYNIFVGAGIGIARIKEKVNFIVTSNVIHPRRMYTAPISTDSASTKPVNNFAYMLSIGGSISLQDNIDLELAYNWKDFGKTKPINIAQDDTPTKNRYIGHDFTVGLRLAI